MKIRTISALAVTSALLISGLAVNAAAAEQNNTENNNVIGFSNAAVTAQISEKETHTEEIIKLSPAENIPEAARIDFDIKCEERVNPAFTIGSSVYAGQWNSGGSKDLIKLTPDGEIEKTLTDGYSAKVRGDKIAVIDYHLWDEQEKNSGEENGDLTYFVILRTADDPYIVLSLYDKDFNLVKSLSIPDVCTKDIHSHNFAFDENTIVYTQKNENGMLEIKSCDWNYENHKTLITLADPEDGSFLGYLSEFELADGFVAFRGFAERGGEFYGVCDLDGNGEIRIADELDNDLQVVGKTAMWYNAGIKCDYDGKTVTYLAPSGEIILYKDGEFETIKLEDPSKDQDVFLTAEDEFFTVMKSDETIRQYKNGIKIAEYDLGYDYITQIIRADDNTLVISGYLDDSSFHCTTVNSAR